MVIKFCTATKARVEKPSQTPRTDRPKTKERMRFLLGANAFKLKNNRNKELLADKKAVWPPQPLPEQKSPFRE